MNTNLKKTLVSLERCLPEEGAVSCEHLQRMYQQTLLLQSQILSVIYDLETFSIPAQQERFADVQSFGTNDGQTVTLTIHEPLPAMKKLTEAIEEHWKAMIHAAIQDAARQESLPWLEKAFVEIEIAVPKGSNNARVWDTSNRAIQVILNNLKGIFFLDDNMEHMAFSVVGKWSEGEGETTIRIYDFAQWYQIRSLLIESP